MIELKNVYKTYHMGKVEVNALNGVSLEINRGEFVAIMGHSGSGKSTLLHILGVLDKPSSGEYYIAGENIALFNDDGLAKLRNSFIGFIFQNFNLLARHSAHENVVLPLIYSDGGKNSSKDKADLYLEKVGLAERTNHNPSELSGGQQQRVAIARALITNPLVLLADEPTGNLDSKSSAEIMKILCDLNADGMTIIMVTHENEIASYASRTVKLSDGKIVSDEKSGKKCTSVENKVIASQKPRSPIRSVWSFSRISEYFSQSFTSLAANKTRAALSVLGVLIGVASVIAMLAIGRGAQEDVKDRIASLGSNLLMVRASSRRLGGVSVETGTAINFSLEDIRAISRINGVQRIIPYVTGRGQAVYGPRNWNTRIEGTSHKYPEIRASEPVSGRFFTEAEVISRARVAVIGQTVLRELFGDKNPLGEFIRIRRIDFQVIGVLPTKGSSGWRDEDDKIMIPINTAMHRLLGRDDIDHMDVQVEKSELMEDVSKRIKKMISTIHRIPPGRGDVIDIRNMADIQQTITATTRTFSYLLGSIAFVSLLVGGIGIMNIMLVTVTERTREIGLRKAIGASSKDVMFQFVTEATVICILGGIAGVLAGSAVSLAISKLAGWNTSISIFSILFAFTFSVIVGLIFGIWPARKAAALNPIEALRYE